MVGETVSHYGILEELGGGGMGVVYKAEDTKLGRPVALKFLREEPSQDRQAVERFQREARGVSALGHPNICTIHDIGEHKGRIFIVMELLEGQTLKERIGGQPLPPDTLLQLAIQIASGLDAAHSKEIVHCGIKPTNIFVNKENQAKILDFGLANLAKSPQPRRTGADAGSRRTEGTDLPSPDRTVGTVAYLSPEQVRGEEANTRTDVFSFGAVLYEMATGCQAFNGSSTADIMEAILDRDPTPPRELNPDVPDGLEQIIDTALEKDSKLRYKNAAPLRNYLVYLKRDTASQRTVAPMVPSKTLRRSRTFQRVSVTPLLFIGLALFVGIAIFAFVNRCTPTHFSRGEAIALGAHRLTVSSVETAASGGEELELIVYHSWVRVAPDEERRGFRFRPRLTLVDSEGTTYGSGWRMDVNTYHNWQEQGAGRAQKGYDKYHEEGELPQDWLVSFTVPRESKGFSLLVTNPNRQKGQPCSAVVSLGR
jgi:serine/threonine protein kinase